MAKNHAKTVPAAPRRKTAARDAVSQLAAPESMLMHAMSSLDVGVTVIGRDYTIRFQNDYLTQKFGDVTGQRCYQAYMGYSAPCPKCPLEQVLEGKIKPPVTIKSKNGRYYDVLIAPLPDPAGKLDNVVTVMSDVTSRRKSEMQLRENEQRLKLLFDKAPDPYMILDMTGHFREINKAAEELCGYKREEMLGKSCFDLDFINPEDSPLVTELMTKNAGGEPAGPTQFRLKRKDGEQIVAEVVSHPLVFNGVASILCMARDVSQRERLERQRGLYLKILERVHSAQTGSIQELVRSVRDIIAEYSGIESVGIWLKEGVDCEHCSCGMVGGTISNAAAEGDLPTCVCDAVLAGKLDTRQPFFTKGGSFWTNSVAGLLSLPDGQQRQTVSLRDCQKNGCESMALIPLKTDAGNIGLIQLRDKRGDIFNLRRIEYYENIGSIIGAVLSRRQALEQLQESEGFNSSLMENAPNPITVINPDTSLRYVNPAFEKLTGYKMAEVAGTRTPYPWWPKDKAAKRSKEMPAFMNSVETVIDQVVSKSGKRFTVELKMTPVKSGSQLLYYLAHWTDITGLKETEDALRREKDRAQNYLNMAGTMLMVMDRAGNVTLVNRKFREILGYTENEVIGKNWFDTFSPKDTGAFFKAHYMKVMTGEIIDHEYEYHESSVWTKGGDERIIAWYCQTLYDEQGKPLGNINSGEDITERRRAEELLKVSQANYNAVVDNANIGISVIQNGQRVYYNAKMYEMLGYTEEDYRNSNYLATVHPDDRALAHKRITQRLKGGKVTPESVEMRFIAKSGDVRWIETRSVAIQWNGEPAVQSFMIDITERRRAEELLKESEEFNKSILDNAPNPMVVTDLDTAVVYANPAFEKLTGFNLEEIAGVKTPYPWWLPELYNERQLIVRQDPNTSPQKVEGSNRKKNGERFWVSVSRAMINVDGVPRYRLTNWVDLTERKQEEEQRQAIIQAAIDGFHLSDPDGKLVDVNDAACKMLGYTREEMLKMYTRDFDASRSHQDVLEHLHRLKTLSKDSFDTRHRCKDGHLIDVTVSSHLLNDEGGHVAVFVHDITARKKYEQRSRELKVLKEVDFLRRKLLSNVSHELRTPLASIKGFVSTLLRTDAEWSPEDSRDFLETIDHETDKLVHIINDLLDMSRIDAGELRLNRNTHSIGEVYESVRSTVGAILSKHKLIIEPPTGLPEVSIDLMRIDQVLTNLVENAVKYSADGTEITVRAEQKGTKVVVSVADHGEGISEEAASKVFDRFYQIESIATGHRSGTGLGLSICRGIIEAHGGKIWVESKLGVGSTFSFSVPVSK